MTFLLNQSLINDKNFYDWLSVEEYEFYQGEWEDNRPDFGPLKTLFPYHVHLDNLWQSFPPPYELELWSAINNTGVWTVWPNWISADRYTPNTTVGFVNKKDLFEFTLKFV